MNYIIACDLTRAENLKLNHTIPIDTLVEVNLDYSQHHGVRGFVVEHTRDCDGEPLYAISLHPYKEACEIKHLIPAVYRFMISDGWTADCFKIIREV